MARDTRRDEGQFYAYGKRVMPIPPQDYSNVKHSDFDDVAPLPERFNDDEARDKMNTILSRLKSGVAAVALLLGAAAYGAGVIVQTAPKRVIYNDEQVVTNVVFDETGLLRTESDPLFATWADAYTDGNGKVGWAIDAVYAQALGDAYSEVRYTARDITAATNELARRCAPVTRRVAMFVVPVNAETNGVFCGFELKASTNNFSHAGEIDEGTRLQFYAQSELADTGIEGSHTWDKMRLYVCTHHGTDDVRRYTRITNTIDWPYPLTSVVVLVDTSCLVRHPGGDWLRDDNEELTWCYCRDRAITPPYEQEPGTNRSLWRPIAPVRWFTQLPDWAGL